MANKANVKTARVQLFIDGSESPLLADVSGSNFAQALAVLSGRAGATPEMHLVEGHPGQVQITFLEHSAAVIKLINGIESANKAALAAGSRLPPHALRVHNPGDGSDTSKDIVIPAVVFTDWAWSRGPTGVAQHSCVARIEQPDDPELDVWWIGYVEPEGEDETGGIGVHPGYEPVE